MSAPRYCKTCPPGTPTRLSRYNKGEICGPCEKTRRDDVLERLRAERAAEAAETCREAVLRVLGGGEPLTNRQVAEITGRPPTAVRMETMRLRRAGVIEHATMIGWINRYRLAEHVEGERAA